MQRKPPHPIKRRDFLISTATLAGVGLPALGLGAARPCPPSTLSVSGGGSTTSACQTGAGQLPVLTLTSAAPSGTHPWTFGHAFRKGDIPAGSYITADANTFQADVRNRWSDGSVKFAVLSGVTSFTQNQPRAVQLSAVGSAPSGGDVSEPTSLDVAVTFSGAVTGTYTLQSALGVNKEAWGGKGTAGRVRKILGPVMSEFHYYVPTSDSHLSLWFYVRRYATGSTEVETVVENGWLNVASPGQRDYTVNVRVGGASKYNATLSHLNHTRWSRVDWVGLDPAIAPRHDGAYLQATKFVPNYTTAYGSPSDTTLNGLPQNLAPFEQGLWPAVMGNAGGGGKILNNWDAMYVTSGDARAYRSVVAHAQAGGRYGIHYRDETTGKAPLYSAYPNGGYAGFGMPAVGQVNNQQTFTAGGTEPPVYAKSHAVPLGFLAYIVTGRRSFQEQAEFQANVAFFASGSYDHFFEGMRVPSTSAGTHDKRGTAWAIRHMAAAVVCVPDSDPNAAQYRAQLGKTLGYYGANYTNQNSLGAIVGYSSYNAGTTDYTNFMEDSLSIASAWACQAAADQLGADAPRAQAFVLWRLTHIVGRMGDQSGYCYRDAAIYTCRYADSDLSGKSASVFNAGVYPSWATVYSKTLGAENSCGSSKTLNGSSGADPSSLATAPYPYWGLVHTALSFAVDLDVPGAGAAWSRYVSASNYAPQGFGNNPVWGVVPR